MIDSVTFYWNIFSNNRWASVSYLQEELEGEQLALAVPDEEAEHAPLSEPVQDNGAQRSAEREEQQKQPARPRPATAGACHLGVAEEPGGGSQSH